MASDARSVLPPARTVSARVHRWGPAFVLRVPEDVARDLNLREDDVVEFRVRKRPPAS